MKHTSIILLCAVTLPIASPVFATDIKAPKCLILADSTGKPVGTVLDINPLNVETTVFLQYQGEAFGLLDIQDELFGLSTSGASNALFWKTPDCTGTPYIFVASATTPPFNEAFLLTTIVGVNNTLYAQTSGSAPEVVETLSIITKGDLTCSSFEDEVLAVPARPLFNTLSEFTPPYRIVPSNCQ